MMANMRYLYNETFCAAIIMMMMMIIIKTMIWKENVIILHVSNYHHHHHQRQGFQARIFFSCKIGQNGTTKKITQIIFFLGEKKEKIYIQYLKWPNLGIFFLYLFLICVRFTPWQMSSTSFLFFYLLFDILNNFFFGCIRDHI